MTLATVVVVAAALASACALWLSRSGRRGLAASAGQVAEAADADGDHTGHRCVLCGAPLQADPDELLSRTAPGRGALQSPSNEARQ